MVKQDQADFDTIVVPSCEITFAEVFLKENRWHAPIIAQKHLDKIKYCAIYRRKPISGITHIAPVQSIEVWEVRDGKTRYVLNFAEPAHALAQPVCLPTDPVLARGLAPQAPRYTTYAHLLTATHLAEIFGKKKTKM